MLPNPHQTRSFDGGDSLAASLAEAVHAVLETALSARGTATLAVSGGRTPAAFLHALFHLPLPWWRVQITLVDDRCVPHDHDRSNVRLIEAARALTPAAAAPLIALTAATTGAPLLQAPVPPSIDAVVLGMGTDGHTASLFPGGDTLASALATDAPRLLAVRAPGAPEPRITLSLPAILAARALFLHVEGTAKHAALRAALAGGPITDMPVRAVLRQTACPVTLFTHPHPQEAA